MDYRVLAADDLPRSADMNDMRRGCFYVVSEAYGRVVVESDGFDTRRDAATALRMMDGFTVALNATARLFDGSGAVVRQPRQYRREYRPDLFHRRSPEEG